VKNYIDTGFMKLFSPHYLFKDYETKGYAEPLENNELFEEEKGEEAQKNQELKNQIAKIE